MSASLSQISIYVSSSYDWCYPGSLCRSPEQRWFFALVPQGTAKLAKMPNPTFLEDKVLTAHLYFSRAPVPMAAAGWGLGDGSSLTPQLLYRSLAASAFIKRRPGRVSVCSGSRVPKQWVLVFSPSLMDILAGLTPAVSYPAVSHDVTVFKFCLK